MFIVLLIVKNKMKKLNIFSRIVDMEKQRNTEEKTGGGFLRILRQLHCSVSGFPMSVLTSRTVIYGPTMVPASVLSSILSDGTAIYFWL